MRTVAIVQARMGSTRLPAKVLTDLHGSPMLEWVLRRTAAAAEVDDVVVATTVNSEDDRLADWCAGQGWKCFRGSEEDVLSRYHGCAAEHQADIVVRVTADDPLKDPSVIGMAIRRRKEASADYCSNTIHPTFPEGLDVEVFTSEALARAHREARLPSESEHVTPYIWKNPSLFRIAEFAFERNLSTWRWTVDKPEDLEFMSALLAACERRMDVGYQELISAVDADPSLLSMCTGRTVRNEGYIKSISMESQK